MMRYAEKTTVPIERSKASIEKALNQYGATAIGQMEFKGKYTLMFELLSRRVRMEINLPKDDAQECRRLFRVLLLKIKARLECINDGDSTLSEEFMPYIMLPDGQTVGQQVTNGINKAYLEGKTPQFLLE